ncbi:response regulator [Maritimibacter fusiformis]|uniref:Response regulator n=1 Tax=Maritimibacter fusiformis TaxID=2603819 RepID=A0A5D0RI34_9RHOB|nr:response regulator [Maritimibacter fusiformis]TYB81267.1 response regulator [Maritimibacter fusiformis]
MSTPKRVLVLDDEVIVAMDLAQTIEEEGHAVIGPFHTVEAAMRAVSDAMPDCAVLDVNLGESLTSEPVAAMLDGHAPILFLSGYEYAGSEIFARFPGAARLPKPLSLDDLLDWVRSV